MVQPGSFEAHQLARRQRNRAMLEAARLLLRALRRGWRGIGAAVPGADRAPLPLR